MKAPSAVLLLALAVPARADHDPGANPRAAGQFLLIGVSARAAAMGEAQAAHVDDATALHFNPAGLTRIEKRSATLMHASHFGSSSLEYAAYGQRIGRTAFGMSVQYMSYGKLTETDALGNRAGTFSPNDVAASFGAAHRIEGGFLSGASFGAGAKLVRSKIADSAQTYAFDVGMLSPAYFGERLRLGASGSNFGGTLRYSSGDSDKLPTVGRVGASYKVSARGAVALDAVATSDDSPHVAAGTEYDLVTGTSWRMAARFGVNSRYFDSGAVDAISGGVGVGLNFATFDYAFVPGSSVGNSHRASLTFRF